MGGVDSFIESTGIRSRRRSKDNTTASDLCYHAAKKLIEELGWDKSEIDALIFVTQTPDYILPATSCLLQDRLGLSKDCYTLEISLGCSGWVYALSTITALMQNGTIRKALLLAGDTVTKFCSPEDKSTYPLFGDAGTATALEYMKDATGFKFIFNTDASGYETIIIREGSYRNTFTSESLKESVHGDNISRRGIDLELDGINIFSFGITKAPKSVKQLCERFEIDKENIDFFTFHQASGFGVGLSWGCVYFETDKITVPELIEI